MKPVIKCDDNLAELKNVPSGSVDLVYIDPPFNSGKDWGDFDDRWENMNGYLNFMRSRIHEIHRVLKEVGTVYIHLKSDTSYDVKPIIDEVFGKKSFRNDIVWTYSGGATPRRDFPRKHDVIFRYVKKPDANYVFNPPMKPYSKNVHGKRRNYPIDVDTELTMQNDWWTDIKPVHPQWKGKKYQTQKPENLLERIILTSSNKGDTVLDAFAGSGTTCAVAKRLGRKSICIDQNPKACKIMEDRLA